MKNIIRCDKCGGIGNLIHDDSDQRSEPVWINPEGWNNLGGIDLCKGCSKDFVAWLGFVPNIITWSSPPPSKKE